MDGGFRLNGKKVDSEMGGEAKDPTLLLFLSSGNLLAFNKSAADIRNTEESLAHVASLRHLDICYERFSQSAAVKRVMELPQKMLCDVLLDQTVLPGVGNIIKNEALFDSGVMPEVRVSALSEAHVNHLVKMTRDFSLIFYRCRRDGKPLWPYLKLYNKEKCKQCDGKITKTKMGDDSARLTWFCATCMSSDPNKIKIKLPSKNSLLGWVQSKSTSGATSATHCVDKSDHPWTCSQCTLINKSSRNTCEVCSNPNTTTSTMTQSSVAKDGLISKFSNNQEIASIGNKTNERKEISLPALPTLDTSLLPNPGSGIKRKLSDEPENIFPPIAKVGKFSFKRKSISTPPSSNHLSPNTNYSISKSVMKMGDNHNHTPTIDKQKASQMGTGKKRESSHKNALSESRDNSKMVSSQNQVIVTKSRKFSLNAKDPKDNVKPSSSKYTAPFCTQHKVQCRLQRVHKEGANHSRVFWCCPSRSRCSFFQWADDNFPICEGHGKRAVLRTVLKLGPNNGKKFFACPLSKTKQCGFFEWVDGMD